MKFVRLGDYVINVSEIKAIKKIGSGCDVYMLDGTDYRISFVEEEAFENAMAYICCGGVKDEKTDKG
jgi:hypothetical protein